MCNMSKKGFAASDNGILATVIWFRHRKASFLVGYQERKCAANKTRCFSSHNAGGVKYRDISSVRIPSFTVLLSGSRGATPSLMMMAM
ncbi:hypothetical protein H5410_012602 [Solanum commersonii]|uniref:Uncharacterized protein n=1 Tax=Solanum commersonii TaxID=4109 RepID=A0A9J6AS09_SOLCO|nr:hypothetical protein H5410_012602 [Solanum commersonii]